MTSDASLIEQEEDPFALIEDSEDFDSHEKDDLY